jgi:hypothetical protein
MPFTQLALPIPVNSSEKGKGVTLARIDYGPAHDLIWVSAIEEDVEICSAPNPSVRLREIRTLGRTPGLGDPQPSRGPISRVRSDDRAIPDPEPRAPLRADHTAFP